MNWQLKITETYYQYEFELGKGPIDVFIPYDNHVDFEDMIMRSKTLNENVLLMIIDIFEGHHI